MQKYAWLVAGAGPAGILAVGKLLDAGVPGEHILWLADSFNAGDIGAKWFNVPSNTIMHFFLEYFRASSAFNFDQYPDIAQLEAIDPEATCLLGNIMPPLNWVTNQLKKQVVTFEGRLTALKRSKNGLDVIADEVIACTNKAILALGSEPLLADFHAAEQTVIPLEVALNPEWLATVIDKDDRVGVFGASHSAILVLKNLLDLHINTTNFYRSPLKYAIRTEQGYLYDNTGLKGLAAKWAREHIDGVNIPQQLSRIYCQDEQYSQQLARCNKIIYAIGFAARKINLLGLPDYKHDPYLGIIAPDVFGFGIAHPQLVRNEFGSEEYNVGMFKFVKYIDRVLPIWLNYAACYNSSTKNFANANEQVKAGETAFSN